MLSDTRNADRSLFSQTFDICIIGAGPAGITLARRLARSGWNVALMEGGDVDFTDESQDLYIGEITGIPYTDLDAARLRYLGGTSNHWGGACRELDAYDFTPWPHIALSGWPISKSDLDPYQPEVNDILDLKPPAGFPDHPIDHDEHLFRKIDYRQSGPTRFGRKYKDELVASVKIQLVLNANLVDLRLDSELQTVTEAVFRGYGTDDPGFTVQARIYCLCCGGMENPRILLNARSQALKGIGNNYDLVGRYFCEHPFITAGEILFEEPFYVREEFAPTPAVIGETRILNYNMHVAPWSYGSPLSLPKEVARSAACATPFLDRLVTEVLGKSLKCDNDAYGITGYRAKREEAFRGRLDLQMEQSLLPGNRIMLIEDTDRFGLNKIAMDWNLGALDHRTIRAAVMGIGTHLAAHGIGRVKVPDWLLDDNWDAMVSSGSIRGSMHHMCTTRMSDNAREGVVDADCRIHGMTNLYVGGSSVFATAGHATPTYTICQLALRLGDHLTQEAANPA